MSEYAISPELHAAQDFWGYLDQLVLTSRLVIDRPRGTAHPRYPAQVYPLDYGFLEGTSSSDGGGIDVWLGSVEPKELVAILLTVDLQKRDAELKLIIGCSQEEQQHILDFMNSGMMRAALISRPAFQGIMHER